MKVLLIDNYDSFTYNLVHALGEIDSTIQIAVHRNDAITVEQAAALNPSHLIISPGPCTPCQSGISTALIEHFQGTIPILGVCLGHQVIAAMHGMAVKRHSILMHGKTSQIHHDDRGIFHGLPNPFAAARYHSLIVDRETVGDDFEISAWTDAGEIMGIRRKNPTVQLSKGPNQSHRPVLQSPDRQVAKSPHSVDGVQFHPESFMTRAGSILLRNFLVQACSTRGDAPIKLAV